MSVFSTDSIEIYVNQTEPFAHTKRSNQEIFKKFIPWKSKGIVKNENFNTHIIRTIKKVMDCLNSGQKPYCRKLFSFEIKDPGINRIWREIDLIYYYNIGYFRTKLQLKKNKGTYKSMNYAFLKEFFKGAAIKDLYYFVIDLLFYYQDINTLSKNLCLRCCTGNHREDCDEKWKKLKEYLKSHYLNDILTD